MSRKHIFIIIAIALVVAVFFVGRQTAAPNDPENKAYVAKATENLTEKYPLLNKAITVDLDKHFIINFLPLRNDLEKLQKQYSQKTYVYFLYLNNGSWIGLNEREKFTAASTVKVPLAMATYKAAEEGKINLQDYYILEGEDLDSAFGDGYKLGAGTAKTIEEFIGFMLEQSDNTAANAILHSLDRVGIRNPFDPIYEFFGWTFDFGETPNFTSISVKTLSNMFLALYNAKYINTEHSHIVLSRLANTPFNNQIVAGTPNGVKVAHKIGFADENNTFSDCGIIYAPNRHYILCLGSSGAEEKQANKFMADVSRLVYDYVINN